MMCFGFDTIDELEEQLKDQARDWLEDQLWAIDKFCEKGKVRCSEKYPCDWEKRLTCLNTVNASCDRAEDAVRDKFRKRIADIEDKADSPLDILRILCLDPWEESRPSRDSGEGFEE